MATTSQAIRTFRTFPFRCRPYDRSFSSSSYFHVEKLTTSGEDNSTNPPKFIFLHGLLGQGRNLRTFARDWCQQQEVPSQGLLIDLPGHGFSKSVSTDNCLLRLRDTLQHEGVHDGCPWTLVGHSMGGRIALQYVASTESFPLPKRLVLLDTVPGGLNASVMHVIHVAQSLKSQLQATEGLSRKDLLHELRGTHKIDQATAQWLASSWDAKTADFNFDVDKALELVDQFFSNESKDTFVERLARILQTSNASLERVDLVMGGKNQSWASVKEQVDQLRAWEGSPPGKVSLKLHVLPNAGHWVHIDDKGGLISALNG